VIKRKPIDAYSTDVQRFKKIPPLYCKGIVHIGQSSVISVYGGYMVALDNLSIVAAGKHRQDRRNNHFYN
jgi:hypothetical protein